MSDIGQCKVIRSADTQQIIKYFVAVKETSLQLRICNEPIDQVQPVFLRKLNVYWKILHG